MRVRWVKFTARPSSETGQRDLEPPAIKLYTQTMSGLRESLTPEPEAERSAVRYCGPFSRSLRTAGWDLNFECNDIWLTVELSDDYKAVGRASGQSLNRIGTIGSVHLNPPGQVLDLSISGNYRALQYAIPVPLATTIASEDHDTDGSRIEFTPVLGRQDWPLARLLCRSAVAPSEEDRGELLREIVSYLMINYCESYSPLVSLRRGGIAPAQMRRTLEYIEENLQSLTIKSIAAEVDLSPFHFGREFKRVTGETPWSFVISRRVARALKLLGNQALPVAFVARAVGFADARHLNHRMMQRLGCSPTQVRSLLLP